MTNSVLVITSKEDITVDFVIAHLQAKNADYYRLNTEDLGSVTKIHFDGSSYSLSDSQKNKSIENFNKFGSVYFRRPMMPNAAADLTKGEERFFLNEVSTLLEGLYRYLSNKYWLNAVFDIRMLENKPYQLSLASETGLRTPDVCISNDSQTCSEFLDRHPKSIFKPLKAGLIEEPDDLGKVLYTSKVDEHFIKNIGSYGAMPVYLQAEIEKNCDLRVTVVGDRVYAAAIRSQDESDSKVDWRKANKILPHSKFNLPDEVAQHCLTLCRKFELDFAALDFIVDKHGEIWFLEINPNGQWAWIEALLGYPISEDIASLLLSGGRTQNEN